MDVSRRAEIAQSKQDVPAKALYFKRENEGMLEVRWVFGFQSALILAMAAKLFGIV